VRVADPLNPGFFVKTGQQRTEGLELGLQGEVTRNWSVYAAMPISTAASPSDQQRHECDRGIHHPRGQQDRARARAHRLAVEPVRHSCRLGRRDGIIYQSESFTSFSNAVKLPGFTRVDAALYYTRAQYNTRSPQRRELVRQALFPDRGWRQQYQPRRTANGPRDVQHRFLNPLARCAQCRFPL
jgi:catecholate siderophore receptor